jgi:hypothetical protein
MLFNDITDVKRCQAIPSDFDVVIFIPLFGKVNATPNEIKVALTASIATVAFTPSLTIVYLAPIIKTYHHTSFSA